MAEQMPSKRQREETQSLDQEHIEEPIKRHKSYNHILSLLESEEDEPNQDLSSLITTLQQELSSHSLPGHPTTTTLEADQENLSTSITAATSSLKEDEDHQDDDKERVIRHLLEASDDELGIPNREDGVGTVEVEVVDFDEGFNNGGNGFDLCDGLWDLEDEAANFYALLQSELFM